MMMNTTIEKYRFLFSPTPGLLAKAHLCVASTKWPAFRSVPLRAEQKSYAVLNQSETIGLLRLFLEGDTAGYSLRIKEGTLDTEQLTHLLLRVDAYVTRLYHPKKIVCQPNDGNVRRIINGQGYFSKGRKYQKQIEEWRYRIDDSVFDTEGFIIHQGKTEDLKFGYFDSKSRGCGWIATYNLCRMYGIYATMEECAKGLDRYDLTGKVFGQDVYSLYFHLRKMGLPVRMSVLSNSVIKKSMGESSMGILLYVHKKGSHYTAYRNLNDGTYLFYNAVYGRTNMIMTFEAFAETFEALPTGMLIWIKKEHN